MTSDYTPLMTDTGSKWEVEAIIDENFIDDTPYYKVHWASFNIEESTWEPLDYVEHLDAFVNWIHMKAEKVMMVSSMMITSKEPSSYTKALASPDAK